MGAHGAFVLIRSEIPVANPCSPSLRANQPSLLRGGGLLVRQMIPGFALGFAATIGVSLVTEPPPGVSEEFDSVWRAVGRPFRPGGE